MHSTGNLAGSHVITEKYNYILVQVKSTSKTTYKYKMHSTSNLAGSHMITEKYNYILVQVHVYKYKMYTTSNLAGSHVMIIQVQVKVQTCTNTYK